MGNRTALFENHQQSGAKLVDFGGWDMPIQYTSLMEEHRAVREHAGMFDVSHMTIVDISGSDAKAWLRKLLANDVARLHPNQALYTGMLNEDAGVIDDLIVYHRDNGYRLVVNCATREKDLTWMQSHQAGFDVTLKERSDLSIIAVQGPEAMATLAPLLLNDPDINEDSLTALKPFYAMETDRLFIGRTGYTGEDGVEIMLSHEAARQLWDSLLAAGVKPAGLGARDTLRLEAGMNLYGHDMDESISPLAANMAWTICWEPEDRDFIGRTALQAQREQRQDDASRLMLKGLVMEERGVLREGLTVHCQLDDGSEAQGQITSGTFSPTLKHSIALARIPANTASCEVELRNKRIPVRIVRPGFVRFGKKVFD